MEANTAITSGLIKIAPAPARASSADVTNASKTDLPTMHFNCRACVCKKVKCNRAVPACLSCRKAKLQCVYEAHLPPKRKRSEFKDVYERLAQYERILQDNNLLPAASGAHGKSRYIDSVLLDAGEGDLYELSDSDSY